MKISFQNPTKGPLITVEFESDASSVLGFVGSAAPETVAKLRAAANGATSLGATSGVASTVGPWALIAMLFSAGDSHPRTSGTEPTIANPLSPEQLRCLADPYDTSAECAAVRSGLMTFPVNESIADPSAARATAATATTSLPHTDTVDLPIPITEETLTRMVVAYFTTGDSDGADDPVIHAHLLPVITQLGIQSDNSKRWLRGVFLDLLSHGDTSQQAVARLLQFCEVVHHIRLKDIISAIAYIPDALAAWRTTGKTNDEIWPILLEHAQVHGARISDLFAEYSYFNRGGYSFNIHYIQSTHRLRRVLEKRAYPGGLCYGTARPNTFAILDELSALGWSDAEVTNLIGGMTDIDDISDAHFRRLPRIVAALGGDHPERRPDIIETISFAYLFDAMPDLESLKLLRRIQLSIPVDIRLDLAEIHTLWQNLLQLGWTEGALRSFLLKLGNPFQWVLTYAPYRDNFYRLLRVATTLGARDIQHQENVIRILKEMGSMDMRAKIAGDPNTLSESLDDLSAFAAVPPNPPYKGLQYVSNMIRGIANSNYEVWNRLRDHIGNNIPEQGRILKVLRDRAKRDDHTAARALHNLPKIFHGLEID